MASGPARQRWLHWTRASTSSGREIPRWADGGGKSQCRKRGARTVTSTAGPEPLLQARALAATVGFTRSCLDETGILLCVLAAHVPAGGRIAELGTGAGVGTAYLAQGMHPTTGLWTAEIHLGLAQAVQTLFAEDPRVHVIGGDFAAVLREGPFDLLFADVKEAKLQRAPEVISAMATGGLVILDDFTPVDKWPPEWQGQPDRVRDRWLTDPAILAVEIRTDEAHSVLLAVRKPV